jgi:hypothetical protein
MDDVTLIGVDLAERVFHLHGAAVVSQSFGFQLRWRACRTRPHTFPRLS